MKKQNKRQTPETLLGWTKFSFLLPEDERIQALIQKEGMRAFGAYVFIVINMLMQRKQRMTLYRIKQLSTPGYKHPEKLVENYPELFELRSDDFVYPLVGFTPEPLTATDDEPDEGRTDAPSDADVNVLHVRAYREEESRAEKSREKDDYHHQKDDVVDDAPIDFISQIPKDSQWTETALMQSNFGPLITRNWAVAIDAFRNHTIVNIKSAEIHSVDDAKRYFYYYITNATTGAKLKATLEEYERQHIQASVYSFEDATSAPGHRCYNGIPLPDEAPARPTNTAEWDYDGKCWIEANTFIKN